MATKNDWTKLKAVYGEGKLPEWNDTGYNVTISGSKTVDTGNVTGSHTNVHTSPSFYNPPPVPPHVSGGGPITAGTASTFIGGHGNWQVNDPAIEQLVESQKELAEKIDKIADSLNDLVEVMRYAAGI